MWPLTSRVRITVAVLALAFAAVVQAGALSVRDFGAKGDGRTDDTAAIRKALEAVQKRYVGGRGPRGPYYGTSPELVFPSGRYRISDSIRLAGTVVRGEGYACLEQADPDKDVFVWDYAWRLVVSGLTFVGGRRHLALSNPNLDTGSILVRGCKFYISSGVAVEIAKGSNSTLAVIRDCEFIQCGQALVTHTDQTVVRDCWITSSEDMRDQAVIENRGGRMVLDNLLGVPLVNGADQRWVDNHGGNLTCTSCRFGGEGGGFTPVVNFSKFRPQTMGPTVLLDDCFVCANGNHKRNCAVYCEEVPNRIEVRACNLAGAALVKVRPDIDPATYFRGADPNMLAFRVDGNIGPALGDLPGLLAEPVTGQGDGVSGLSDEAVASAMARARAVVAALPATSSTPAEWNGHRQQTASGKYMDIPFDRASWALDDPMDATADRNSQHLAVAPCGDDVILMRRTAAKGTWPHLTVRHVSIDLDRYPFLCWKQRDTGVGTPASYAVKVLDKETETLLLLLEDYNPPWDDYLAYNLRELLNVGGSRRLDIRYYYLGQTHSGEKTADNPTGFSGAEPGDFIVIDFIRFEAE